MSQPSPMIDTDCHLAVAELDAQRRDMIRRAQEAGVVAAIVVGEHYEDNLRILELAAREPFVLPALGHHPCRLDLAARDVERTLQLIEENRSRLVAIGEVGLDYRVAETPEARQDQRSVFSRFIDAGKRLGLPLSVHVRSAGHYVIDLLAAQGCERAVLHAFDGKAKYAQRGVEQGLCFSVPGTVLISQQKRKLARALPLDRLLLESDTPALSPDRDKPSEPAVIARVVAEIAELRRIPPEEIREAAFRNTLRVFELDPGRWR